MPNDSDSSEIYDGWFDLYKLLATLPLNKPECRKSLATLKLLKAANWGVDFEILENYWARVEWVANNCSGNVLEVGSGMGNITRWIARNPEVRSIVAVDILPRYIDMLKSFCLEKVHPYCVDINNNPEVIIGRSPYNCVVLSEIIEHLSTEQEIQLKKSIDALIASEVTWLLTTPINYMEDLDHVRGFRPWYFRLRSKILYGRVIYFADNTMQQFVRCHSVDRNVVVRVMCEATVKVLDYIFQIRPSGHPYKCFYILYRFIKLFLRGAKLEKKY